MINGFAFNNKLRNYENDVTNYHYVVDGLKLKRYNINFIGGFKQLISDSKYIYLLSNKTNNSVYILNIENNKFFSKYFKIWSKIDEPVEIEFVEDKYKNYEENKNSNNQNLKEKNNLNIKNRKCIIY